MLAWIAVSVLQSSYPSGSLFEKASKDDCEILVAVGNAGGLWGRGDMFALFDGKNGAPGYEEACDWKSLGATQAPHMFVGGTQPNSGFYITRPKYGADGRHATVSTSFYIERPVLDGKRLPRDMERFDYELEKSNGRWKVTKQKELQLPET